MTEELKNNPSVQQAVLEEIKKGKVKQAPKWHFVTKTILIVAVVVALFSLLLYFASFAIFTVDQSKLFMAPSFGMRGVSIFIQSLPWLLLTMVALIALGLELIIKRYSLAYRRPLFYSLGAIVVVVIIASIGLCQLKFHEHISQFADEHNMGIPLALYHGYGQRQPPDFYDGTIIQLRRDGFELGCRAREIWQVIVGQKTAFPFGSDVEVNDEVLVIGHRQGDTIQAEAVRPINDRQRDPENNPFR